MSVILEQVGDFLESNPNAPWLSSLLSHGLKPDIKHSHIHESSEYWQDHGSRAGSPFESESSDSDCSSDFGDDPLDEVAVNPSSTVLESLFLSDAFRFDWEGFESIGGSNALGLEFMSKGPVLEPQAVATSTPQAESLQAPPYHQDARNCDRLNYKHQAHQAHSAPQPDSPVNKTLAGGRPQDIGLQDEVSDASGLKMFQVYQRAHADPESRKSHKDDDMETWDLLRAPRMRYIPLPGEEEEEEGDDDLLYSGPSLSGWLNGSFDCVPKTITLNSLDFALPVPFSSMDF